MKLQSAKWLLALGAGLAVGCAPALNWREVRPEGGGVLAMLPCKPSSYARNVQLAGAAVQLSLLACSADGQTWALAVADLGNASKVPAALAELQAAALANLGATTLSTLPLAVAGIEAGAQAGPAPRRFEIAGRLPDGKGVVEQVALFSQGARVYQATVLGPQLPPDDMDMFFGGLRLLR